MENTINVNDEQFVGPETSDPLTLSGLGYFRLILDWGGGEITPPRFFALGTSHGHVNYVVVS